MKNLLYKELRLCLNPQVIIFACFSLFILIPNWPSGVAFVYILSGLATVFPRGLADKDIMYSAMLPIRKGDVVKGKTLLIVAIEVFSILISIPAAVVKALIIDPALISSASEGTGDASDASYIAAVSPNMVTYGTVLMCFGVYALILIPWYYKNPTKINWPQIVSMLAATFVILVGVVVQAFVPALHESSGFWIQLAYLFAGLLVFVFCTYLGERLGEKHFAKVDL